MSSDDEGYIVVTDPINPNHTVRAKLLKYEKVGGQDYEYKLPDGTRIRLIIDVDTISRVMDPKTNQPAVNPKTREPIYSISWGVRVRTIYSEDALNQTRSDNNQ
jgi:hypothetical protein